MLFNAPSPICPQKFEHILGHLGQCMHFWDVPSIAISSWETEFDESNQFPQQSRAVLYLVAHMGIVNPPIERQI